MRKLFVLAFTLALCGCSNSNLPKTYSAKGKVIHKESREPVKRGSIDFISKADHNLRAVGEIREGGIFELIAFKDGEEQPGAAEGEYDVFVELPGGEGDAGRGGQIQIPGAFVIKPGDNEFTIEVPKPKRGS
jgi:hypothetical protein